MACVCVRDGEREQGWGKRREECEGTMAETRQEKTVPPGPWVPWKLSIELCSEPTEEKSEVSE